MVSAATGTDSAVVAELRTMLLHIEASPATDRAGSVNAAIAELVQRVGGAADGRPIIEAVVGVIVLAAVLTPATSPGSAAPNDTYTTSVESGTPESSASSRPLCPGTNVALSIDVPCPVSSGALVEPGPCAARFQLFAYLETEDSTSVTRFRIDSIAGIADLEWVDPFTPEDWCPIPEVEFTGSMLVTATSNANSFLAHKTIHPPMATHTQTLDLGGTYNAQTWVEWDLGKIDVDVAWGGWPPIPLPVVHYFAPPAGNYRSTTNGRATWRNGFRFVDSRKPAKDYRYECAKYGLGGTTCMSGPA